MMKKELDFNDSDMNPKYLHALAQSISPIKKNKNRINNNLFQFDDSFTQNKKIIQKIIDIN